MQLWLVLVRFVHYATSLVLFGLVLFPFYAYPRAANRDGGTRGLAISLSVSLLILASGILWFIGVTISMSGGGATWEAARFVLTDTSFGAVAFLRLGAAIAAIGTLTLLVRGPSKKLELLLLAICAILLGSLAGVGHTQIEDSEARAVHTLSDSLHLVGAGAWLGGLVGLLDLAVASFRGNKEAERDACEAALRFSVMGYAAVAILVVSGLINSWFLVGSFWNLITTTYGQLLLLKLLLFSAMVAFAGFNRFFVVPTLLESSTADMKRGLRKLLINAVAEQSLGLAIILIVSFLGVTEPAATS
ncbi:putative copper resistance protein D [Bradyrhizobium sp. Rc2d]|uniref:copper homeostasis membrane protein CopD n=1 Tax=Bradyrhizobium sp. Rc2d TaxID=1855321 RepID=UPI0008869F01|nr:copper homeostasis membrane protein CopD [Bradyrhizobium sp. Rc2d]SDI32012.1 putative copper resistance protein D [Bradyrhizobium sp. Rc2d]